MSTQIRLGAILWLLTVQLFVAQFVAQAAWPAYSPVDMDISALGLTACQGVDPNALAMACSPLNLVFNASMVLNGVLVVLGICARAPPCGHDFGIRRRRRRIPHPSRRRCPHRRTRSASRSARCSSYSGRSAPPSSSCVSSPARSSSRASGASWRTNRRRGLAFPRSAARQHASHPASAHPPPRRSARRTGHLGNRLSHRAPPGGCR